MDRLGHNREKAVSRRFLILGGIVLVIVVLIFITSRNDNNRIFNVETVYDTVFVADSPLIASDTLVTADSAHFTVVGHHRSSVPKNPWRGHSKTARQRHPLHANAENCQAFARMISTLFSPYYYVPVQGDDIVVLKYETCRNDSSYTFGVVCRWFSACPDDGVEWCSADSLPMYGTSSPYPVFVIIGIGGSPDSPETMYVLRAWTIRNELTPNFLNKAHRKRAGKKFYYKPEGPWLN